MVPSTFGRQQVNSETSRLCRRSFLFSKEWACSFRKVTLALTWKQGSEDKLLPRKSLPAQEAEGLEGLLTYRFWKTVPTEQDFKAYQIQKTVYPKQTVPKEHALGTYFKLVSKANAILSDFYTRCICSLISF